MKIATTIKLLGVASIGGYALMRYLKRKPAKAFPVKGFDVERLLGDWYHIAHTPAATGGGLEDVITDFSVGANGDLIVTTLGIHPVTLRLQQYEGVMRLRGSGTTGAFNISYRYPLWKGFNIVAVDPCYHHLLAVGSSSGEAYVLSRYSTMPPQLLEQYRGIAHYIGVPCGALRMVKQCL